MAPLLRNRSTSRCLPEPVDCALKAASLGPGSNEKGSSEIVFKAMGRAINKTVTVMELIKRRIVGLHQNTSIGSTDITNTWEPLEEGLLPLETTRHVCMITITLSKEELDTSSIRYQPPLPADQVKVSTEFEYDRGMALHLEIKIFALILMSWVCRVQDRYRV